jgi:hypothetical protein
VDIVSKMSSRVTSKDLTIAEREVRALKRRLREVKRDAEGQRRRWMKKARQAEARARETEVRLAQASAQAEGEPHAPEALSSAALTERLLPDAPLPSSDKILLARRNAAARWHLLQEFGAFSSEQIADLRSRAKNRHALANRWRNEGRIFAVEHRGQLLYPAFQFDPETFDPLPVISGALAALPRADMTPWEVGLWWTAENGWLDGARPVDALDDRPEAVVQAAQELAEPSPF